ncbi:Invasion associated locus B (IalB) protein [Sulfitobacter sp. THAF37]|uniref:invasion associated locus B family protein n=1 Tax=Sulfitobacter sp. THAF37 TaxID=2587855 RepID=UPI0012685B1D|nr:invasion associated locus B family protein [Sulfitobacter sp. THAF37]QFT60013.1 Invasion associated locus B (IalB) protein [Sulfitobacter sp. THAF37]
MSRFLTALPIAVALACASPAAILAQTTEAPAPTEEPAQTEQTEQNQAPQSSSSIEDQLSLGENADGSPEVGKPFTKEVIGAWEMRCIQDAEGNEPCQMYQLLDDGQGAPVAEFSLFRLPDGGKAAAGATIVVPLETALPQQLTISVDGGQARRYPYAFCNPVGCYVRLGLTPEDINVFKRGKEAVITIIPALAPDQQVKLSLSLDGFTASYDKVSTVQQ